MRRKNTFPYQGHNKTSWWQHHAVWMLIFHIYRSCLKLIRMYNIDNTKLQSWKKIPWRLLKTYKWDKSSSYIRTTNLTYNQINNGIVDKSILLFRKPSQRANPNQIGNLCQKLILMFTGALHPAWLTLSCFAKNSKIIQYLDVQSSLENTQLPKATVW